MVTFLVAEWPRGRGWVVMVIEFLFGGAVRLSTPSTQIPASPGHGKGPVGAKPFGGRGWTSVPRGHRARGEVPRSLQTACLEQDAPPTCAQGPRGISWVYLSLFPASQHVSPGSQTGPLSHSSCALITALARLCSLCLGPQSTWPPGLCPAGSQAAGAAGSCSLPSPCVLAWASRA